MPCLSPGVPPAGNPEQPFAGMVRIQNSFAVESAPEVSLGRAVTMTWYRWPSDGSADKPSKTLHYHLPMPMTT